MRNLPSQTIAPTGGMNQDVAPERLAEGQYVQAENYLPVDTEGQDTGLGATTGRSARLVPVRADALEGTLPAIPEQERYEVCFEVVDPELPYQIVLDIEFDLDGAPVTETITVDSPLWVAAVAAINDSLVVGEWLFAVAECDCITVRPRSFRVTDFLVADGGSTNVTVTITAIPIPGQSTFFPIGEASTNDYWVLFTTAPENHYPGLPTAPNYGQVWVFRIDTPDNSIELPATPAEMDLALAYHGELNFSRAHEMTSVEAAPESDCINNIVFTDNYSPLRLINVLEPFKSRLLTPGQLRLLQPEAKLPPITFLGQGRGELLHGAYFYTYRLLGPTGQVTPWAQPTTRINNLMLNDDPGVNDYQYTRAFTTGAAGGGGAGAYDVGSVTSNSNQLVINGVDTAYLTAEVACLYCEVLDGSPLEVFVIGRYTITGDTLEFTHATMEVNFPEVTFEEVVTDPVFVNTVKAVTQSEGRLILGNYCTGYDLGYTQKIGVGVGDITLGFVRHRMLVDTLGNVGLTYAYLQYIKGHSMDFAVGITDNDYTTATGYAGSPQITLNGNEQFLDHKGSYIEHLLRSYMSQEWYRGGIVYWLTSGQKTAPFFIGNIQIPKRSENLAPLFWPLVEVDNFVGAVTTPECAYVNPIGVSLSGIDVSAIKDQIKGFSIVRSKAAGQVLLAGFLDVVEGATPEDSFGIFYSPDADSGLETYFLQDGDYLSVTLEVTQYAGPWLYKYYQNAAVTDQTSGLQVDEIQLPLSSFTFTTGQIINVGVFYDERGAGNGRFLVSSASAAAWNSLIVDAGGGVGSRMGFYAQLIRPGTPFDGDSEARLEATEWVYTGHYQPVDECNTGTDYVYDAVVYGGDTFVDLYSRLEQNIPILGPGLMFAYQAQPASPVVDPYTAIFPVEARINSTLRSIPDENTQTFAEIQVADTLDKIEVHDNRTVFIKDSLVPIIGEASTIGACDVCFPYSLVPTQVRFAGEDYNRWQNLLVNEQRNMEIKYGEINKIATETSGSAVIVVWQENATGMISVGTQRLQADGATIEMVAGSGTILTTPRYVSFQYGTQHCHSVARTIAGFAWVDAARRAHLMLGSDGVVSLSEDKGMRTWMSNKLGAVAHLDNPCLLGGLHSNYDYEQDILTLTLKYDAVALAEDPTWLANGWEPQEGVAEWTLAYSANFRNYPGFYTPTPPMFFSLPGNRFLSFNPERQEPPLDPIDPAFPNDLYLHFARGAGYLLFYGETPIVPTPPYTLPTTPTPARLVLVFNEDDLRTKTLMSFVVAANKVFSRISTANNDQNAQPPSNPLTNDGYYYRFRGGNPTVFAQPRNGKWEVQAPPPREYFTEAAGWQRLPQWVGALRGEYFYVVLEDSFIDLRDIASVTAVYAPIANNT